MSTKRLHVVAIFGLAMAIAVRQGAASPIDTAYNSYGYPGMIDMPVAHSRPDGELGFSVSHFKNTTRNTLTFQITPRLSGSFRYALLYGLNPGSVDNFLFDRSFSLHYRLADETRTRPAIALGLNDFLGTGEYSSEYIVATKSVGSRFRYSIGMGWGRLAGVGSFTNPLTILSDRFGTRPDRNFQQGGLVHGNQWFRGDAALFGGIEYQATDRLRLIAEYSSDAYPRESPVAFRRRNPFNFSAQYRLRPNVYVSARYLYGSEFGVQLTAALNPKSPRFASGREKAPLPVLRRPRQTSAQLGWPEGRSNAAELPELRARVRRALEGQGLRLIGMRVEAGLARVEVENRTYAQDAQAIGRTARVLSREMPGEIGEFVIVPMKGGLAASELRLRRGDLEELEFSLDNSWGIYTRTRITSPQTRLTPIPGAYPRLKFDLKPYVTPSLFDPDDPLRADLGAELRFSYEPFQGLELTGGLRKKVAGNLDSATRVSDSVLPHVRSDANLYERLGDPAITDLTAAYYFKPGRDLYGRVTAGYLEQMYGGVSAELLWKPVDSRFGLGIEANYVKQRDFDQLFGFRNYEIATGHVSAYYNMGNGYHAQLDVGRYLAGDWGATMTLDREFSNGWKVGAFATLTDVPFSRFGEGSFDKGIRITVPIDWVSGEATRENFTTVLRPVTRDGGARVSMGGRLYDRVRGMHQQDLRAGWGRFWR